jgi:hypothetical protein
MKRKAKLQTSKEFSAAVGRALRRAAKVARKTARMHGTPVYVWKNGKVVAENRNAGKSPFRTDLEPLNRTLNRRCLRIVLVVDGPTSDARSPCSPPREWRKSKSIYRFCE